MPWDSCVITLNSDSTGSLYTGDIVTGFVRLQFKHIQKIEHIEFLVYGRCKAYWSRSSPLMPYIRFYGQKKKILYINIDLFENLKDQTVKPGLYDYPFHFALPKDLPSTFRTSTGTINYWIKIKSSGVTVDLPFVVLSSVNLNHVERLLVGIHPDFELCFSRDRGIEEPSYHDIHKMFWNTGTITLSVKTYTGFASQQTVPMEISIKNDKKVKIFKICVLLIQKLRYTVTDDNSSYYNIFVTAGHKNEEKKVCKVEHSEFLCAEKEMCNLMMEIPHIVPSSINTTDPMIGISYVLRIICKFAYHTTMCEDIPVTVATIPVLHHDFNEY